MSKSLSEIYSEYGLKTMIEEEKKELINLQKEYDEVCAGKRYNPLCAEGWKREISKDMQEKKEFINELIETLKEKGIDVTA